MVSAGFDWVWQIPALPVAFLVLAAAVLAPGIRATPRADGVRGLRILRLGVVALSVACLLAIAVPLATTNAVRKSQAAASRGNAALALRDAQQAARVEPGAASPELQLALVQELQGRARAALLAARRATTDEPRNWIAWLIVSRLEAEAGNPSASLDAFRRSRSLNPRSPLFAHA
jgi:tetratricopeptide (TPR) repeat protein